MIKKISNNILNKINPNVSVEDRKWINVFNEIQHRVDVLFEALVSWYSGNLFFQHLIHQKINDRYIFDPLRHKGFIYESYIYVELNNLLDPKGNSSITRFINHFTNDVSKDGHEFTSIFGSGIDFKRLQNHFEFFTKWLVNNIREIDHIKYKRDKNFSHVDHNFDYDNKVSFEYLIKIVVFLSDYASILSDIMKMINFRVYMGEPIAIQQTLIMNSSKEIIRVRFRNEINAIINMYNFNKKNRKIFELNCWDSIEETLKSVELIELDKILK